MPRDCVDVTHRSGARRRVSVLLVAKQDEIDYLSRIGDDGRRHALDKPWSDPRRGEYLQEVGGILSVLPPPPCDVLDLGAGTGWTSCLIGLAGYRVTATDLAPDMVGLQQVNAQRYGVRLASHVADFESLPFGEDFDVVVFYDCLHHADDAGEALRSAFRVLRPGGRCVTLEPGRGHHSSEDSRRAMREFGTTERDMPPELVVRYGKAAGFTSHVVYARPSAPMVLTSGRWPTFRTIGRLAKRFVVGSTPMALRNSQLVVLTKPNP